MPLTLDQVKNNCSFARALMHRTRQEHFGVGAFNIDNQETLLAICRAAQELAAPVLVEVSHGEVEALGLNNIRDMVDNYKEEMKINIFINLDHSPSVEAAKAGIDAGFEFIHIDISQADHAANDKQIIDSTREVALYAKKTGAMVESELHYFGGSSNLHQETIDYSLISDFFSTPESAKNFVASTGIDTFAVAIGNLHGKYPVPKKLNLELLTQIRAALDCNISLHGGSDTPLEQVAEAARIGVSKININSDLRFAYRTTLEKQLKENPNEYAIVKLTPPVIAAVQNVVKEKIQAFGSAGKSNL